MQMIEGGIDSTTKYVTSGQIEGESRANIDRGASLIFSEEDKHQKH